MTKQLCRFNNGSIEWLLERPFSKPEWVHRTRDEAEMILKSFQEATWCKSITDEYARQIEAAIRAFDDEAENEDE